MPAFVDLQSGNGYDQFSRFLRIPFRVMTAPEHSLDPGDQNFGAEGFGDVVIGAIFQSSHHVLLFSLGGKHDDRDRNVLFQFPFFHQGTEFGTAHSRQHEIKENTIYLLSFQAFQAFLRGIRAGDMKTCPDQVIADQLLDIHFIFNDEDM